MSPGKRKQIDPLERAIEAALSPGSFISYKTAWSFVDDVQTVANGIENIVKNEPERAARLYETFIAACHEKADEIDDSGGNFGMLVEDLFRGWIKARQVAKQDPDETASSLLSWMEDDPYGFCYDLDREVVKVLDKKGLEASERGDLASQIELWNEKKENDRLISRLHRATDEELEGISRYWTQPLARKLERSHPDISARVYRALCMRIVNAGKSKYYDAALDNIDHAKKCYAKAGLDADWQAVVADVRKRHFRKKGFMAGFENIVSGAPKHVTLAKKIGERMTEDPLVGML